MKRKLLLALFGVVLATAPALAAQDDDDKSQAPRLPLPRFASLRSDKVNMRTGPGTRYPIEWVYERKGLPIEIIAEYDFWRRVRDPEGATGWIHKNELTGRRMAIVTGQARDLRKSDAADATPLARVEVGAIGQIVKCDLVWCKINFDGTKGFLSKSDFWGAYEKEKFD